MMLVVSMIMIAFVIWAVTAGLFAVRYCQRHGVSVNPLFLGIEMLKCLSRYRKISRTETGRVGPLFYHYVIPINLALALVIIMLVVRSA